MRSLATAPVRPAGRAVCTPRLPSLQNAAGTLRRNARVCSADQAATPVPATYRTIGSIDDPLASEELVEAPEAELVDEGQTGLPLSEEENPYTQEDALRWERRGGGATLCLGCFWERPAGRSCMGATWAGRMV